MIGTLEGFRDHAAERGDMDSASADGATIQAALVRAGDYIRAHYRAAVEAAAPELPTAAYIAATAELARPGVLSLTRAPTVGAGAGKVLVEVKGIKWEQAKGDAPTATLGARSWPIITTVDAMLAPYGVAGGSEPTAFRGLVV